MAAKRTSAISILAALMLIASFAAALLPQAISPQPVYAATQTYTFASGGGTDKWCWHGHVHLADWNNGHPTSPSDFASSYGYAAGGSTEYTAVSSSNDAWWRSNIAHDLGCCSGDRNIELFKFTINENPSDITNIQVKWEGHGTTGETLYYTTEKLWKPSNSTWNQLHNQQNVTSDTTWTDNIASGCSDYIDGSGYLYVIVCSQRSGINNNCGIWTDYIEIVITYTTNSAPTIGTVEIYTTSGDPLDPPSMSPQVEYNIKVPVTDADTLDNLVTVKATLYYDSDGSYSEGEVPTSGNTQTCAILIWTKGGSPSAWTIDPSSSTTWSIVTANCSQPTLSGTTGTFEFHFKPGKVATYTGGSDNWHIYVKATDSASGTGTGTKTDLTMNWYGEIVVNTGTINWGEVTAGLDFAEGDPSEETSISITYICNGAYNQQVKADTSWSGSPSGSATLNTGGTPGANEFSLKADDDGTLDAAVTVSDSYQTFDTGTLTSESGNAETGNSLWLKLGTPCTKATYSGTMYYQIAH